MAEIKNQVPYVQQEEFSHRRSGFTRSLPRICALTALWVGGIIVIVPFVWMLISSFKSASEILSLPPTFFPQNPTLRNYQVLFRRNNFGQHILNSIFVTSVTSFSIITTSAILGFVFAKFRFKGRDLIFIAFLATMALPFEVLAIPLLNVFSTIGGIDRLWGLSLPFLIDPFAIFICRQYMLSIPNDYLDAARLDGLGNFRIFSRVIVQLSNPAIAAVAILSFLYNWDQLFWPLVLITSEHNKTVPLGIVDLSTQFGPIYDLTMAASTLTIVPILIVFFIFRRKFIEGMMMQGLKG